MKLLVTGADGFVGRHVVAQARDAGFAVTATGRGERPSWLYRDVNWVTADLLQPEAVERLAGPWWGVVHLAAASIPASYGEARTVGDGLTLTLHAVDAAAEARFLYVSSCHVYHPSSVPRREDSTVLPQGRYGLAKALGETAALLSSRINARVARPFNHIGSGMQDGLMIPSLVSRVKALHNSEALRMEGRNSIRDFLDVRDIAAAYLAILSLDAPESRIFNVCSGEATAIGDLARLAMDTAGKSGHIHFKEVARSADDTDLLVGDPLRLIAATGWVPRHSLADSVRELIGATPT